MKPRGYPPIESRACGRLLWQRPQRFVLWVDDAHTAQVLLVTPPSLDRSPPSPSSTSRRLGCIATQCAACRPWCGPSCQLSCGSGWRRPSAPTGLSRSPRTGRRHGEPQHVTEVSTALAEAPSTLPARSPWPGPPHLLALNLTLHGRVLTAGRRAASASGAAPSPVAEVRAEASNSAGPSEADLEEYVGVWRAAGIEGRDELLTAMALPWILRQVGKDR